jgi:hypothetical protein
VGEVTREVLAAARAFAGRDFEFNPKPSEVPWTVPLDEDDEHRTYDTAAVRDYVVAAHGAAGVLAEFRAPHSDRATPVNAWWGSFDLAVTLHRDGGDFALGWWPGDARYPRAAFYAYVQPAREGFGGGEHWNAALGEYILDDADVQKPADALTFARALFA